MKIEKIGFPSILVDNDMKYLSLVFSYINRIDPDSDVIVIKTIDSYSFNITCSHTKHRKNMIVTMDNLHESIGMKIEFSKSINISSTISFSLVIS